MFVYSLKTTKRQLGWGAVCAVFLAAIVMVLALWPDVPTAAAEKPQTATSADGCVAFLAELGYTAETGDVKEVQMPETLDDTLIAYNQLQQTAQMDLTPYCGKRLKCRTMPISNHPSGEAAVAHIYLYKDKIVAGDISSVTAGKFQTALLPAK